MRRVFGIRPALLTLAVLASAVAAPQPARAQTASEIATAKQWFADGLAKEEKNDYAGALDLFKRAVQVKKTPQILYHVGLCESRTGALVEALVDLDGAAALARNANANDVVTAATTELADVKKRVPSLEVHGDATAKPQRFVVDGATVALPMLGTAMPMNPGEHSVSVEYGAGLTASQKVTLAERDAKKIDMPAPAGGAAAGAGGAAVPVPSPETKPPPDTKPVEPKSEPKGSVLPWVLVVGGGALLAGGVVTFVIARGDASDLDKECPSHSGCSPSLKSKYDSATTLNAVGIVLGAVGVVAAGAGITMLAMKPSASPERTGLYLSPGGLAGRF